MVGDIALNEDMENKKRPFSHGNGPCDVSNNKEKEIVSPPAKKLKQARLPFKPINSPRQPSPVIKKTKDIQSPLSSSHDKASRQGEKRTTPIKKADTHQSRKQAPMKGKKIGFSGDASTKSSKQIQAPFTTETEVSSSSGDIKSAEKPCDSTVGYNSTTDSKKTPKSTSMDCFVQSTQQPLVSTSDIVDIADADDEMEDEDDQPKSSNGHIKEEELDTSAINTSVSSISSMEQMSSDEESSDEEDDDEYSEDDDGDAKEPGDENTDVGEERKASNAAASSSIQENSKQTKPASQDSRAKPVKTKPMSLKACIRRIADKEQKIAEKQKQREERKRKLEETREEKKRMKLESRRAREEKREAEMKLKMEEKKMKQMEKQKKKDQEEQEKLEKKKIKDEERQKKQQELDAKQEEKKKKQEERQKQEEGRKQKEAAVLKKKEKQKEIFKSFFKDQVPAPVKKPEVSQGRFAPFEVKDNMVLAPGSRVDRDKLNLDDLDQHFQSQDCSCLYVDQLKQGSIRPGKSANTPGPVRPDKESSMEVDPQPVSEAPSSKKKQRTPKPEGAKMKLLQFHENYRPAYFGTWCKETSTIAGRNPWKKDEVLFDYEVDSDDEWEEPGESLSHSEGEDEDDDGEGDDDEEEDGFFVPHGYLSAGEGAEDDDDPDKLKARQAAKAKAWENELRRRCEALKPIILSFIQVASTNKTRQEERKKLEAYRAIPITSLPIATSHTKNEKSAGEEKQMEDGSGVPQRLTGSIGNRLKPVPEEAMPDLLSLVHGNTAGIKSLIKEFRDYWRRKENKVPGRDTSMTPTPVIKSSPSPVLGASTTLASPIAGLSPSPLPVADSTPSPTNLDNVEHVISKRQLDLKINSIAVREKRPEFKRICWYVHQHVLDKYKKSHLPVPTIWDNGLGPRDANGSPLPAPIAQMTPTDTANSRPAVNKPVSIKPPKPNPNTVNSLLQASRSQAAPAGPAQPIFIPSGSVPSAFNKVGPMQLPGLPGTPVQPMTYMSGGTLLQPGLAPIQMMPLGMQHAINPVGVNASSLLQQAAANSILDIISTAPPLLQVQRTGQHYIPSNNGAFVSQQTGVSPRNSNSSLPTMIPKSDSSDLNPHMTKITPPRSDQHKIRSPSSGLKKGSPKSLDAAISKLYESNALPTLASPQEKAKQAAVKKKTTLTKFFNVKTTKPVTEGEKSPPTSGPVEANTE